MIRIAAVSALALALAGCNATVYGPRPMEDFYRPVGGVYVPPARHPVHEPAYLPMPPRRHMRCATVWNRTPHGYVERQVCGNHIP